MVERKPAAAYEARPRKVGRGLLPITRRRASRRMRGAAILLSLWALFLLSAMIISWALDIGTKVTNSGYANRSLEAVAMACSGVDVALHPAVLPYSPVLRGSLGPGQTYQARITGEAGRLNLNLIVAPMIANPNDIHREVLRKFLEVKGIDLNDRERMIDCLIDWIDPDNLVQINGAEDEPGYKPDNRPLSNLEDLKRVRGWDEFTSRPNWEDDLTLATQGDAKIDVQWATRDVLLALPGATEGSVDRFLSLRRGPDEEEGTEDDFLFDLTQAKFALGLQGAQSAQLDQLITVTQPNQPQILRIVSTGKSGAVTRTVRVVVRKAPGAIQLIPGTWKEL